MKSHVLFLVIVSFALLTRSGCDTLFTSVPEEGESFDQPLPGLTRAQRLAFARGDESFDKRFTVAEGLGPIFNQTACESCHPADGKAHPNSNLTRFGFYDGSTFDILADQGGPQMQNRAIPGIEPEWIPARANGISVRSGPAVFGMGLIEAIPDSAILSRSDPNDANGDGISGKPNFVPAQEYVTGDVGPYSGKFLGRFGRKSGSPFLLQQIVAAYQQDMGITTDYLPKENPHPQAGILGDDAADPELTESIVNDVAFYLQTLAPPKRGAQNPLVDRGENVFTVIGCASCHTPTMRTGPHPTITALDRVEVNLYSDLLLHDMGEALADNFWEGDATGREWRTTPLWGLRLYEVQLGGTAFYLHDGRTSDLREAITLHGGEALSARDKFLALPQSDVEALLAFLRSL